MDKYSVWVGGVEVNDYTLTFNKAVELAHSYIDQGYGDTAIEKIEDETEWYDTLASRRAN